MSLGGSPKSINNIFPSHTSLGAGQDSEETNATLKFFVSARLLSRTMPEGIHGGLPFTCKNKYFRAHATARGGLSVQKRCSKAIGTSVNNSIRLCLSSNWRCQRNFCVFVCQTALALTLSLQQKSEKCATRLIMLSSTTMAAVCLSVSVYAVSYV